MRKLIQTRTICGNINVLSLNRYHFWIEYGRSVNCGCKLIKNLGE